MPFNLDELAYRDDGSIAELTRKLPGKEEELYHATWNQLVVFAMRARQPNDHERTQSAIADRIRLARKIAKGGEITLKKETTVEMVKECCKCILLPDLFVCLSEMIDPSEVGKEQDTKPSEDET